MNLFRGNLVAEQVFPYPNVLSADQQETLEMLIGPTQKFFNEVNNPAKNDEMESVSDDVMQGLKEMGAFGLQVCDCIVTVPVIKKCCLIYLRRRV